MDALLLVGALGAGLVAGIFFAFSSFVMRALARIPDAHGIAAMQSINIAVIHPVFMMAFLGTGASCAALLVLTLVQRGPEMTLTIAGSLLYLVGTLLVTMVFNVPRNAALAALDPASAEAAPRWRDYVASWTAWNHARTAAALAAAACFTIALRDRVG